MSDVSFYLLLTAQMLLLGYNPPTDFYSTKDKSQYCGIENGLLVDVPREAEKKGNLKENKG